MAAVVNERDVLLQAAASRDIDPSAGKALILSASSPVFHIDATTAVLPATIALKAQLVSIKAPISWSVTGASGLIVASDNLSATLRYVDMTADSATVTATSVYLGVTYQQSQIIQVVKDGLAGKTTALVYAYKRAASAPTDTPGAVTFDFTSASITSPAGDALANGWTKTIPSGSNPLYVTVASAVGSGTTDTIASYEWAGPVQMAQNGAPGASGVDGMNVATVFIYQRTSVAVAPALPSSSSYAVYTFSTGTLTGLDNGWSATVPATGGKYLYVSQATAASNGSGDVIFPSEWAAAVLMAQDGANGTNGTNGTNGINGTNGQRGTINITTSGSSWTDAAAVAAISANGYGAPVQRDMVTISNGTTFAQTRVYVSGSWLVVTAYINGNLVVAGTIAAAAIAADTLTGQTYQTSTGTTRITINESGNNTLLAYESGTARAAIGAGATFGGFVSVSTNNSSYAAVTGKSSSSYAATEGYSTNATIGTGVYGSSTGSSGTGVLGIASGSSGTGGRFTGVTALSLNGRLTMDTLSGSSGTAAMNAVVPVTNNAYSCGAAGYSWSGMYSQTALNVTSDRREKTDIEESDLGLEFILRLVARRYKLLVGQYEVVDLPELEGPWLPQQEPVKPTTLVERPGTRWHYGLIADEVRDALGDTDAAIWCLADANDPESRQSLRYEELIGPLIKAIQQLDQRLVILESR